MTIVPGSALGGDDVVGLRDGHLGRLLDDDVLAGLEGLDGDLGVHRSGVQTMTTSTRRRRARPPARRRAAAALGGQRLGAVQVGGRRPRPARPGHASSVITRPCVLADDPGPDDGERGGPTGSLCGCSCVLDSLGLQQPGEGRVRAWRTAPGRRSRRARGRRQVWLEGEEPVEAVRRAARGWSPPARRRRHRRRSRSRRPAWASLICTYSRCGRSRRIPR